MIDILLSVMWAGISFMLISVGILFAVLLTFVVACIAITAWAGDDA
jgi:hypothetical protein